jgi:hypothetical protein
LKPGTMGKAARAAQAELLAGGETKWQPQERQHSAGAERGGTRDRVPPARDTLFRARDRSRTAETPRGPVHESPVRRMPRAQRYSDI